MIVRELVTKLGFQADDRKARQYERTIADIRKTAFMAAAAIGAVGAALGKMTGGTARAGDEIAKTSQRLGIAADELQRYRYAAERSGVAQATFDMAMQRFGRRIGEAAKGTGEAQDALAELNISATNADGSVRDLTDLLPEVADKLGVMENANARNALAMKLFDSEGVRMVQMLKGGSAEMDNLLNRFDELGGALDKEGVKNAVRYTDAMTDLGVMFRGLQYQIGGQLMPQVVELVEAFGEWWKINRDLVLQNISRFVHSFSTAVRGAWGMVTSITGAINKAVKATIGWERFLSLVGTAMMTLIGLKVARWAWVLAGAFTSMKTALMLLARIPIIAAFTLLVLFIEDVVAWINEGDSALGEWLGSWEEFKAKIKPIVDSIMATFGALGDILMGLFTLDVDQIMDGFRELGRQFKKWVKGFATNTQQLLFKIPGYEAFVRGLDRAGAAITSTNPALSVDPASDISSGMPGAGARSAQRSQAQVNARTEVTLQVPAGTPDSQRAFIEDVAERTFTEHWNREISKAMWDFQPSE